MKPFQKKSSGKWKPGGTRPALHRATCANCNTMCEVPFRPNGKKPVLCQNCFRKNEGAEKPAYRSAPRDNNAEVVKQLKDLNRKMDELLHALAEIE